MPRCVGEAYADARSTGWCDEFEGPIIRRLRPNECKKVLRKIPERVQVSISSYPHLGIEEQARQSDEMTDGT